MAISPPPVVRERDLGPLTVRAAVVHDWFQGYHGAERVVDVMRQDLFAADDADIFTFHAAQDLLPPDLSAAIVQESRVAHLPGIRQQGTTSGRWRYLLPYMPCYYRRLDLDAYDLVISSSHASPSMSRPRPDATHVVYCYTPMRYAWMPETDGRACGRERLGAATVRQRPAEVDRAAARRPTGTSRSRRRFRSASARFYGRDVDCDPPARRCRGLRSDTREKEPGRSSGCTGSSPTSTRSRRRGVPRPPYRLRWSGSGRSRASCAPLPPNVELRGWVPRESSRSSTPSIGIHPRRRGGLRDHDGRGAASAPR